MGVLDCYFKQRPFSQTAEPQSLYRRLREAIRNESSPSGERWGITAFLIAIKAGDVATVRKMCLADRSLVSYCIASPVFLIIMFIFDIPSLHDYLCSQKRIDVDTQTFW